MTANRPCPADLGPLFRQEVFKLLKSHGLPDRVIENMMGWHHSGFNVYCGPAIRPGDTTGMENLARYIIRAAFSQERMRYIPATASADGEAKVIYQSKDGRERKVFPALDWLAQLTTHIPNRKEHMVRYGACPALDAGAITVIRAGANGKRRNRMMTSPILSTPVYPIRPSANPGRG